MLVRWSQSCDNIVWKLFHFWESVNIKKYQNQLQTNLGDFSMFNSFEINLGRGVLPIWAMLKKGYFCWKFSLTVEIRKVVYLTFIFICPTSLFSRRDSQLCIAFFPTSNQVSSSRMQLPIKMKRSDDMFLISPLYINNIVIIINWLQMNETLLLLLLLFWAGSCSASGGHWDYNLRVSSDDTKKLSYKRTKCTFFGLSGPLREYFYRLVLN